MTIQQKLANRLYELLPHKKELKFGISEISMTIRNIIGTTALILLVVLTSWLFFTEDGRLQMEKEREYQMKTQQAIDKARIAQKNTFCEEYIKFVSRKEDAPYAYKHCYENPELLK